MATLLKEKALRSALSSAAKWATFQPLALFVKRVQIAVAQGAQGVPGGADVGGSLYDLEVTRQGGYPGGARGTGDGVADRIHQQALPAAEFASVLVHASSPLPAAAVSSPRGRVMMAGNICHILMGSNSSPELSRRPGLRQDWAGPMCFTFSQK
jgi:hypothetical protein